MEPKEILVASQSVRASEPFTVVRWLIACKVIVDPHPEKFESLNEVIFKFAFVAKKAPTDSAVAPKRMRSLDLVILFCLRILHYKIHSFSAVHFEVIYSIVVPV